MNRRVEEARQVMADHIQAGCHGALSAYDIHNLDESRPRVDPKQDALASKQILGHL